MLIVKRAGNDNSNNGNGNGNDSGSNDGNGNTFGNSNSIGSGNSGLSFPRDKKVRKERDVSSPALSHRAFNVGSYINGVWVAAIDPITTSLSSSGELAAIVGSAANSLNGNGAGNSVGNGNSNNGNGNGNGSGSNNGSVLHLISYKLIAY